ncbi:hypothetical protein [Trichormus sp. NMC-1]|uniref:hypothetical protein n=1 Tax=Trichormus sp. NMC-1 TaxID=1853259 RepID=UPI0015A561F0|nr:hypothetical protein [Trichormus sp. NMC-1]
MIKRRHKQTFNSVTCHLSPVPCYICLLADSFRSVDIATQKFTLGFGLGRTIEI